MIATLISGTAASPWVRVGIRYSAIVLAVLLLFLLSLRRSGECAGRLAKRLEITERAMMSNDGCWRRLRVALVLATIWLSGYATAGFDRGTAKVYPPVVEYSREFQTNAAKVLVHAWPTVVVMYQDH